MPLEGIPKIIKLRVSKRCPACGHDMITALDEERCRKCGKIHKTLMHHCPNCMELKMERYEDTVFIFR